MRLRDVLHQRQPQPEAPPRPTRRARSGRRAGRRSAGSSPTPSSATAARHPPRPAAARSTRTRPPADTWPTALSTRAISARRSAVRAPRGPAPGRRPPAPAPPPGSRAYSVMLAATSRATSARSTTVSGSGRCSERRRRATGPRSPRRGRGRRRRVRSRWSVRRRCLGRARRSSSCARVCSTVSGVRSSWRGVGDEAALERTGRGASGRDGPAGQKRGGDRCRPTR